MEAHKKNKEKEKTDYLVVDAAHASLGRLSSFLAKKIITGKRVVVVNSEKAIILGDRRDILQRYRRKKNRGKGSLKGPYFPRKSEGIIRRTVRGMLPKSSSGRKAFKNLLCYNSIPADYAKVKKVVSKRKKLSKFITLGEISREI